MMKILLSSLFLSLTALSLSAQGPNNSGTYYQHANGKSGAALKTALGECIYNRTERSYNDLWTDFKSTDLRADGKIWDMYSGITNYTWSVDQNRGNNGGEGLNYNREHSFPKVWFGGKVMPMYTDLNHLYPSDSWVNSLRGDNPFGEVGTVKNQSQGGFSKLGTARSGLGYSGTVFEPNDEYKGDMARTYFYMVTCYEGKIANWNSPMLSGDKYPGLADWALKMLMQWAQQDPVSEKEIRRNNAVWSIQNNRNPFIDYPGLEQYIWGDKKQEVFHYDQATSGIASAEDHQDNGSVGNNRNGNEPTYNIGGRRVKNGNTRRGIKLRRGKKVLAR